MFQNQAIDMYVLYIRRALRVRDCIRYLRVTEDYGVDVTYTKNCRDKMADIYHGRQETL